MTSRSQVHVWWLNPGFVFVSLLMPFAYAAYALPSRDYMVSWHSSRFFDAGDLVTCLGCTAAFLFAGFFSRIFQSTKTPPDWGKFSEVELDLLERLYWWGVMLVSVAYVIWMGLAARHGVTFTMLKDEFVGNGESDNVRDMSGTLPGVTTMTQFGPAVFIVGTLLLFNGRRIGFSMSLLGLMTIFRSIAYSERLALSEITVPMCVLLVFYLRNRFRVLLAGFASFIWPILAVALLYVIFTGTEYLRSWKEGYEERGTYASVWSFSRDRLLGYYVTALNNGAMGYRLLGVNDYPISSLAILWKFPVLGGKAQALLPVGPVRDVDYTDLLALESSPEFNNPSGIFAYVMDWGEPGTYVFFGIFGFLVFSSYFAFVRGDPAGLLMYPFVFIGLTEIARVPYLTTPRTLPTWFGLFVPLFFLWRLKRNERRRQRAERALSMHQELLAAAPRSLHAEEPAEAAATGTEVSGISEGPAGPTSW